MYLLAERFELSGRGNLRRLLINFAHPTPSLLINPPASPVRSSDLLGVGLELLQKVSEASREFREFLRVFH